MTTEPKPHTVWKHLKTEGVYIVLGIATCSTNGPQNGEKLVMYYNMNTGNFYCRKLEEFK